MGAVFLILDDLHRGKIPVIGSGWVTLPPGQVIMSVAIQDMCDMVAEAAGVGWVRRRIPAKPCSSHTAISANLPPCANNSTDVLAFWRSFAPSKPALFVGCRSSQSYLVFPLRREQWSWNQLGYCHSPRMAAWLKARRLPDSVSHELGNVEDVDKQFPKPIILHKEYWD